MGRCAGRPRRPWSLPQPRAAHDRRRVGHRGSARGAPSPRAGGVPAGLQGLDPPSPQGRTVTEGFGELVASTDPAMVVVTVAADGEVDGCLVGFHSQCSIDPPRHAVWLSVANRTYALAQRATHLAVHRLGSGDRDVAELFGGVTGDDVDKLARCAWESGPSGVPLLERCRARFVGRIVEHVAG